jgi:lipoprotein-anchoring transpeptidase ErfK/SrfK
MKKKHIFLVLFVFFILSGIFWSGVLIYENRANLKVLLAGKFGASADERRVQKPNLDKVPFDVKSFNETVEPYILSQKEENKSQIVIIPGKSNWDKQEEARLAAEKAKKEEEERKKEQVQVEDTGGFCADASLRYLEVDLSSQRLAMCDHGTTLGVFPISSGSRYYPTPTGHFQVNSKSLRAYSTMYNLYMPYWNSFIGNSYGIHELPEYPNGVKEGANMLGQAISHGCIRLGVGAAETVYNWAPVGTPVEVHQ